ETSTGNREGRPMEHPSEETLKRFASGTPSREEGRAVVAHLLKGCTACTHKLQALMGPESVTAHAYDAALDRFDEGFLDRLERSAETKEVLRSAPRFLDRPLPRDRGN